MVLSSPSFPHLSPICSAHQDIYGLTPQAAEHSGTGRWPVRTAEPAVPLGKSSPLTPLDLGMLRIFGLSRLNIMP